MPIIEDGTTTHVQKTISIYSNDGTSLLYSNGDWYTGYNIEVTETGLAHTEGFSTSYDHGKSILGFATSANATEPTYAVGDTFQISADTTLYVIEAKSSGVTVEYDGSVVATIPNGNKATIPIADKKMKSDIVISVPESDGATIPEFTEVEDFAVTVSGLEGEVEISYDVSEKVALPAGSPARLTSVSDANFIANNIKKDVSIFGLTGAYEGEKQLPENVVYYNNMNGYEVTKIITPLYLATDSAYDLTENDGFMDSGVWSDKKTAVFVYDNTARHIRIHNTKETAFPIDNGFGDDTLTGYTMGAWVKWYGNGDFSWQRMFTLNNASGVMGLMIYKENLSYDGGDAANTEVLTMTPYENVWVHIALTVTKDSSGDVYLKTYLNGNLLVSANTGFTDVSVTFLGFNDGYKYYFNGEMKNTFVSKGELTGSEIRQMMFVD